MTLDDRITEFSDGRLGTAERERARAEAAEQDARDCRAERARYGDVMTEKLAAAEAEVERLRELQRESNSARLRNLEREQRLREQVATLTAELAERSAKYMALVERIADYW